MKQFIFFIFFILVFSNSIGATGFSPSSLIFNLAPEETQCKIISINSESEIITADDKWAENKNVIWKVNEFNTDASSLGISINYPSELYSNEREVEVCLSGKNIGEYHGVLLLKEEQQGNSIIQMGIWLKVIIGETFQQTQTQSSQTNSENSVSATEKINEENAETGEVTEKNTMTGLTVEENEQNSSRLFLYISVVVIIFILIIFFCINHKKKMRKLYG